MLLSKEQILAQRLKTERVQVGDGEILVRALPTYVITKATKLDSSEYDADSFVFVNAVVNEAGERIFSDEDAKVIAQTIDGGVVKLVVSKAYGLVKLDDDTKAQIKKNLPSLDTESSGESPSPSGTPTPT